METVALALFLLHLLTAAISVATLVLAVKALRMMQRGE
jgi:hypothetical protein